MVKLQLSKGRTFYFRLEALGFFPSFSESLSINISPSRTQATKKTNTAGAFSDECIALTTGDLVTFLCCSIEFNRQKGNRMSYEVFGLTTYQLACFCRHSPAFFPPQLSSAGIVYTAVSLLGKASHLWIFEQSTKQKKKTSIKTEQVLFYGCTLDIRRWRVTETPNAQLAITNIHNMRSFDP